MFSQRFDRQIILTDHARQRMSERNVADERLVDLIDSGEIRRKDETRLWITGLPVFVWVLLKGEAPGILMVTADCGVAGG